MYRHGEVLLIPTEVVKGKKLPHLILAEGEVTGHKHEVKGKAELYEHEGTLFLKVDEAELVHEDHDTITLPKGNYEIVIQREYEISEKRYREVRD